jgi:hypothetical protein
MGAGANAVSFDITRDARAHRLTNIARGANGQLTLARGRDDRRRDDVLGGLFDRRRKP